MIVLTMLRVSSLLVLFFIGTVLSFPSRPLNERSTELAWQAWLLVDDQNQNKQNDPDGMLRRRITPKSIFIVPTFSPESLPACADGYRTDSMGRCIKIIKLDEDAHLKFLLQELNEKFGSYDDAEKESEENKPSPGPFQLNIPLDLEYTKDTSENADVAILVAPTNGNFDFESDSVKSNFKRTNTNGNSKTTIKIDTTTNMSDTDITTDATTTNEAISTVTDVAETTTLDAEDVTTDKQAIFFWQPLETIMQSKHVENSMDTPNKRNSAINKENVTTTTEEVTTIFDTQQTTSQEEAVTKQDPNYIRFPPDVNYKKFTDLFYKNYASQFHHTNNPDTEIGHHSQQQKNVDFFSDYNIEKKDVGLKENERHIFRNSNPVSNPSHDLAVLDTPKNHDVNLQSPHTHRVFSHRNRDKHSSLWFQPTNMQRQLLLKIPRRATYSRELLPDELSYIFGLRQKQEENDHR